jgi:hypothetical protein
MPIDFQNFLSFAAQASAKSSIALRTDPAAGREQLQLERTSAFGRLIAAIKSAFAGPSSSEARATSAFIQLVRQSYGSTGESLLAQEGIREGQPLRARQVQHIQQRLATNQQDPQLGELKTIAARDPHQVHSNLTQVESSQFPAVDAVNAAIIRHGERAGELAAQANRHLRHMTPEQAQLVDVALIVGAGSTGSASELLNLPAFAAEYGRRLDISAGIDHGQFELKTSRIEGLQVAAASVLNELLNDQLNALQRHIQTAQQAAA